MIVHLLSTFGTVFEAIPHYIAEHLIPTHFVGKLCLEGRNQFIFGLELLLQMRYGFFLSFENNPRFLHALRVGRRFVQAEKLPHRRVAPHEIIAQDGVDEGLQALYPVVDEAAAKVIAEPLLARQCQGAVREERPQFVVQSDKVGVAPQHQPARVGDAIFDAQLEDSESGSLLHDFVADDRYPHGDIVVVVVIVAGAVDSCQLVGPAQLATQLRWPPAAFVHPLSVGASGASGTGRRAALPKWCRRLMGALDGQRPEADFGFGTQVQVVRIQCVARRGPTGGLRTVQITFGLGEP